MGEGQGEGREAKNIRVRACLCRGYANHISS